MTDVPWQLMSVDCPGSLVREQRIKIEITGGVLTRHLLPNICHQKVSDRIRVSVTPISEASGGCGSYHLSDVSLVFPNGPHQWSDILPDVELRKRWGQHFSHSRSPTTHSRHDTAE